jgi:hypothetical protein
MVTKNINLGQIGDFAEDKTEKIVGLGANILLRKLKSTNVPVNEGTMRTAWFQRPVSNLEIDLINKLEYAEPVTFGTNIPPSWKNGYQLSEADGTPIPKDWAKRFIDQTINIMKKEAGK